MSDDRAKLVARCFSDWMRKTSSERSEKPLSDAAMKKMVPMFVEDDKPDHHSCGSCNMRVAAKQDRTECTIVDVTISQSKGTCAFWAKGPAATPDKIHEMRMPPAVPGYVELPEGQKIQCATCRFFDRKDTTGGHCKLWNGRVLDGQCCMTFDNDMAMSPGA